VGEGVRSEPLDELVDGIRRGDRDAVAAVYLEVAPALRGFLRRRVGHGEVADDLVEQTFVALIEHGERFRGDGRALRAWLFRTARNQLYDWAKRADRRSAHQLPRELAASIPDHAGDPGELVVEGSLDPRLVAALATLTPEQREVVELRLVAQLSIAQVAELTARSPGAVKLLQHRAIRRLADRLTPAPVADARIAPDP
jgi:RNA polymerase sigma-70 factor, ECF subfamily